MGDLRADDRLEAGESAAGVAPSLRVGSLCTGIGGLDLAVEAYFGAELAWYAEVEPSVLPVLDRAWPGVPNLGDIKEIDWAAVPPVEIITAGYPCQPFSYAGKRKGSDDPRHLWPYVAEGVRHLRPRVVVLENVRGHLTKGFGTVLGDLAEAGFDADRTSGRSNPDSKHHDGMTLTDWAWLLPTPTARLGDSSHRGADPARYQGPKSMNGRRSNLDDCIAAIEQQSPWLPGVPTDQPSTAGR